MQTNLSTHTPGCACTNKSHPEPRVAPLQSRSQWRCDDAPQFDALGCSVSERNSSSSNWTDMAFVTKLRPGFLTSSNITLSQSLNTDNPFGTVTQKSPNCSYLHYVFVFLSNKLVPSFLPPPFSLLSIYKFKKVT